MITKLNLVVCLALLLANMIATSLDIDDTFAFARRSGLVSAINLMPLFFGGHMNVIANYCGISLRAYTRMYRWLGRIVIIEGFIHMVVAVSIRTPAIDDCLELLLEGSAPCPEVPHIKASVIFSDNTSVAS
ncbi:hypothetical protein F4779DRAFT_109708 [Xylariaceae sp. FL0662B]|nr:hypothetical protein F4779DRAFT_109708 [Xylariaceae sp. FL0662B]